MKIKIGERIEKATISDCYVTLAEAAGIAGKQRQNYTQYVERNKARVVTHQVGDDTMYSLKEVAEDARRMILEEQERLAEQSVNAVKRDLEKAKEKITKLEQDNALLRIKVKAKEKTVVNRTELQDELLRGDVELNKARLRKFNLTNEKIILQLKELCKQELLSTIQPIIARLDQSLTPHAAEVHTILAEMILNLENAANWNEISEDEQSLIDEAKQNTDINDETKKQE